MAWVKRFLLFVLRQYMLPAVVGWTWNTLSYTLFIVSIVSVIMNAITMWAVAASPWAQIHAPWLTFGHYMAIGLGSMPFLLLFVYKFIIPAVIAWANRQSQQHDNPMMRKVCSLETDIVRVLATQSKQDKDLEDIKDKLGIDKGVEDYPELESK